MRCALFIQIRSEQQVEEGTKEEEEEEGEEEEEEEEGTQPVHYQMQMFPLPLLVSTVSDMLQLSDDALVSFVSSSSKQRT